jgi:electron transfer flavoprotein alpha subunit
MADIIIDRKKCMLCDECIKCCPFFSIKKAKSYLVIEESCRCCGQCIDACPVKAIKIGERKKVKINKDEWKGILVYIEYHHDKVHPVSYQMIGKAYELALSTGHDVYGIVIGKNTTLSKDQLKNYPLRKVFLYETEEYFKSDLYEELLACCIKKVKPFVVLVGGTLEGRSLAPRVAVAFKTGLTADCTELVLNENSDLIQIRPAFGGDIMAQIVTTDTRPQFATVRYNVMKPIEPMFKNKIEFITEDIDNLADSKIDILESFSIPKTKGIAEHEVLVVAGKGVRKKEDLAILVELAGLLRGELASTRGVVERGWVTSDRQIGLSGHTVRPKLLIACGVSGSVQFMAGMGGAENIIAINTDINAKIFNIAHYPICGDLYEIIPELINKIKNFKK